MDKKERYTAICEEYKEAFLKKMDLYESETWWAGDEVGDVLFVDDATSISTHGCMAVQG